MRFIVHPQVGAESPFGDFVHKGKSPSLPNVANVDHPLRRHSHWTRAICRANRTLYATLSLDRTHAFQAIRFELLSTKTLDYSLSDIYSVTEILLGHLLGHAIQITRSFTRSYPDLLGQILGHYEFTRSFTRSCFGRTFADFLLI